MLLNMSLPAWPVLFVNEAWEKATGIGREGLAGGAFWGSFQTAGDDSPDVSRAKLAAAIAAQESFNLVVFFRPGPAADGAAGGAAGPGAGPRNFISLQFRCAHTSTMDSYMPLVGIPSILSAAPAAGGPTYYFATLHTAPRPSCEVHGPPSRPSSTSGGLARGRSSAFSIIKNKIDPFEDVKLGPLLGKGSYGRVYRGVWNGAQVAVKVLETLANEGGHAEEVLEATLSSQISHPNIVQTYKHCTRPTGPARDADHEGQPMLETWMVLEFCNKGGLSDAVERGWFRKRHSLFEADFRAIMRTAREVAAALAYLHAANILHGDLTGTNVLLTASERDERRFVVKVADFGLSRVLAGEGEAVTTRSYGTITHMCPELLVDGLLSKAADVYSFGVIVWEMYTGQRPYGGMTHGQILHAVTSGKPLPLGANCPPTLRAFLARCLAPKPEARPTFAEILPLLEELEEELG